MERAKVVQAVTVFVGPQSGESNALSVPGTLQLSDAEFDLLNVLMKQMQAYYPHQEFVQETVEGYQFDMERLAVKFGLARVRQVLLDLRLRVGQKFFPHPVQVLEELEAMAAKQENYHKFQADPNCECRKLQPGLTWVIDKDGDRVMGRCPCYRLHAGMGAESVDTKVRAAGGV